MNLVDRIIGIYILKMIIIHILNLEAKGDKNDQVTPLKAC